MVARVPGKLSHVDLVPMLGIADWEKGTATAGNRGYYLVGDGVLLNQVFLPRDCPVSHLGLMMATARGCRR